MTENRALISLGSAGLMARTSPAEIRAQRELARSVSALHRQTQLVEEQARSRVRVIEDVAMEAMASGAQVAAQAVRLAEVCPVAEPMLRAITAQAGLDLGRIVADAAREMRW